MIERLLYGKRVVILCTRESAVDVLSTLHTLVDVQLMDVFTDETRNSVVHIEVRCDTNTLASDLSEVISRHGTDIFVIK